MLLYEFKADLNAYLAALGPEAPVHTLEELIAFNREHARAGDALFRAGIFAMAQAKGPLTDEAYLAALAESGGWRAMRASTP